MKFVASCLCAVLFGSLPFAAGHVWVVDDDTGPGVDFASISLAVPAAAEGDTILVKAGTYDGFIVVNKSLTIQADAGASVVVEHPITLHDFAANRSIVLRGLDVVTGLEVGLIVANCAGTIWIEECTISHSEETCADSADLPGAEFTNCTSVILIRSEILPVDGYFNCPTYPDAVPSNTGLILTASTVHAIESTIRGGHGAVAWANPYGSWMRGHRGGLGARGTESFLFLSDCHVRGGEGSDSSSSGGCTGGAGGDGIRLSTATQMWSLDSLFEGGENTDPWGGVCVGKTGTPVVVEPGCSHDTFAGEAMMLTAGSPAREGENLTVTVHGPPTVPVWIGVSDSPFSFFLPVAHGSLLLAPPIGLHYLGVTDGAGNLHRSFPVTELGPAVQGRRSLAQAYYISSTGEILLSSGTAALTLDASF